MIKKIHIKSKVDNIRTVENAIDNMTNEAGINQDNYGKILVATLEAVSNAIIHGNKADKNKIVEIEITLNDNNLVIVVKDEGHGFIPDKIPDPTNPENIEAINGRGIFLMTKLADDIKFNKRGNRVTMKFKNIKT
jgi:serine/threonine-protein kinase RsbW